MNHIDVMKQALADMKQVAQNMADWAAYAGEYYQKKHRLADDIVEANESIERLGKAIEEAEKVEPVGQLQEDLYGRGRVFWFNKPKNQSLLYTAPPQREWVGLTKQERLKCFGLVSYFDTNCICVELSAEEIKAASEAIEAKLKEKNT
jgi:hypothetical protein